MNRHQNERGIALALAVFALVIIGGLVSSAFFIGMQEQRVGRNTVKLQQAFAAADGGTQQVINSWQTATWNKMAIGDTIVFSRAAMPNGAGWWRGSLRRLNDELFLITSEGFSTDSTARQKIGQIIRLRPIELNVNAALKSRGSLKVGGNATVNGLDSKPAGWDCPPLLDTIPGIRLPYADSAGMVAQGSCADLSCIHGTPQIRADNTITDSTLSNFGDATFAELQSLATLNLNPGTFTGIGPSLNGVSCNIADTKNWGDPVHPLLPCGSYFPIIWINGDASISGGEGQGILLVNGDLSVQGGFHFYGPVIVKGSLKTTGTGGHFNGGVVARNVDLEQETILGSAVINYSSCALQKALNGSSVAATMRERGWINMF